MKLKKIVKNRRESLGLTQQELAERCHLSRETIQNIESGKINGYSVLIPLLIGLELTKDRYYTPSDEYQQIVSSQISLLLEQSEISHTQFLQAIDDVELLETQRKAPFDPALKSKLVLACYTNATQGLDAKGLAEIFA